VFVVYYEVKMHFYCSAAF